MSNFEEVLVQIQKKSDLAKVEIMKKIEKKMKELSGLINNEGAAYLVAKELGVDLPEIRRRHLQIKNLVTGMKNINVVGRIIRVSDVKEFEKQDKTKGKVASIIVADDTGFFRLPLWNDQLRLLEEDIIKNGDVIQVTNGFARENLFGDVEVSLGKFGGIKSLEENFDLPDKDTLAKKFFEGERKRASISELNQGNYEIQGTLLQIFKSNFIFYVCSICGSKTKDVEGKMKCDDHGFVKTRPEVVFSAVVDDGSSNLRVVFFREIAEKFIEASAEDLEKMDPEKRNDLISEKVLGREILLSGRVKKNKVFDRLEMIVNEIKDLNVLEESKRLAMEIEREIG